MWSISYWFSSRPTINITLSFTNITLSFTNNYLPHQLFVKKFVKQFVSLALFLVCDMIGTPNTNEDSLDEYIYTV